jgi:cell filamentation protein
MLKKQLEKCVDWSKISKDSYMNAMIISTVDSSVLMQLIENALTSKINDREMFMKGIDYSYYYEE